MTISEVRRWYVDWFKINHVVLREERGWVTTLCGDYTTGEGQPAPTENKAGKARVCSKCRKRLAVAILAGEKSGDGGPAMNLTITYATSPRDRQPIPKCVHSPANPCRHYVESTVRAFKGRCANLGAMSGACMVAPMKPVMT